MDILARAVQAIQRNLYALALYLVIAVGASAIAHGLNRWVKDRLGQAAGDPLVLLYEIGLGVFLVVVIAAAQAVVFSRLGKDIDRPLWKNSGDREALQRFFKPWLVLNAAVMACHELIGLAQYGSDDERFTFLALWIYAGVSIIYVPIGGAIMFQRGFAWRQLGDALRPFGRQFPKTLIMVCLNGAVFLFCLAIVTETQDQPWVFPLVDVVSGYFDCVIFAATWLICMLNRQTPEDVDFDF